MSATLLPVLVKCCVLSKRQPRMCQPSRLTLPNGLLNADIKLTRSFALPFPSLYLPPFFCLCRSLSLPLVLTPSLTLSLTRPLPLFLLLSVTLSINLSLSVFPLFHCCRLSTASESSFNFSIVTPEALLQVVSLFTTFFLWMNSTLLSLSLSLSPPTGSIMPSTHGIRPSLSPCCMSCQHLSTAWPMPLSLAWIGIGGAY